jgi:hypothetical protein
MEILDEKNRYIRNPLRCLRALAELALIKVDESMAAPWNETDYPLPSAVERPAPSEDDLIQGRLF